MATSRIGKGTVLADNEEEQYKSPYENALETGKDIAAPAPTTETAIAPSATIGDDGYDDVTEVVSTREPARLNRWYETLFRQDNAGEQAEISDEQRRKMARRERAERVIAGLGDIGTHIANIALAGKGAVPAKPSTTMSANIDNSWQRYNQDIEQRRRAYRQGLNAARQMDYRQYIDDRRQALLDAKEERLRWQQEHKYDLDKLREAKTKAEIARIEKRTPAEIAVLDNQADYWQARANESQARADGNIPNSVSRGRSYGGGSKSNAKSEVKEAPYHTPDGVACYSRDEYRAALIREGDKYGVKYRTKNGQPYITGDGWGALLYEIQKKRAEKGLPKEEQTTTNGSNQSSSQKGTKRDWSSRKIN